MKTFGKVIICILVVLIAIGIAYLMYSKQNEEVNGNVSSNGTSLADNKKENEIDKNEDYIGEEENIKDPEQSEETPKTDDENKDEEKGEDNTESKDLTGTEKAIYVVKKEYALDGQTVAFDHMEGNNYVIKVNSGTAVTWYLVDGTTWEAEEY